MIARSMIIGLGLTLAACVSPDSRSDADVQRAANEAAAIAIEVQAASNAVLEAIEAAMAEEFREVARNCELPAAKLIRDGDRFQLGLPPEIYAVRDRDPVNGRVQCITHWGLEVGQDLEIVEAR
jgi:hypothetical protein